MASLHGALSAHLAAASSESQAAVPVPREVYGCRLEPELRTICREAGLKITGTKAVLLERVVNAWQRDVPGARYAVRRVLRLDPPAPPAAPPPFNGVQLPSCTGDPASFFATAVNSLSLPGAACGGTSTPVYNEVKAMTAPPPPPRWPTDVRCVCGKTEHRGHMLRCDECKRWQHAACLGLSPGSLPAEHVCELCRAQTLNPFSPYLDEWHPVTCAIPAATPAQLSSPTMASPNSIIIEFSLPASILASLQSARPLRSLSLRVFLARPPRGPGGALRNHRWPMRASRSRFA
jgi:hypothetical protein